MKKIVNKIWLPVVTALLIVMGVLLLTGAISCTQVQQTGETVMKPAETESIPSHSEDQPSEQASAAFEKKELPALPHEYTVTGVGTKPHADELSFEQVAAVAVDFWKKVFGDRFKPEDNELYVVNTGSGVHRSFDVYSGSQFADGASYICNVDSVSGQPVYVKIQTPYKQENIEDDPNSADIDLMNATGEDPKYEQVIEAFINDKFADGRSIVNIEYHGAAWDFLEPDIDMTSEYGVEMSEGECYLVFVAYPSFEVVELNIFPLGSESLEEGYIYPQE